MAKKVAVYMTDEDQEDFEKRFVEAVCALKRDVSQSELIVKHLRKSYQLPIIEVMQ